MVLSILWNYIKTYMKTRLAYRSDFIIEIITDLAFQLMNLLFIIVVFQHTKLLGGWTQNEVIFIYGYFMIPNGLFGCLFNLWNFTDRYIVKGEMDRVLTRPVHNLVQLMLENLDPSSLFGALAGLVIMIYAWMKLGMAFDPWYVLVLALFVLGSVMIYAGIYIILTAISFYSDAPTGIQPMMYNIQNYGRYPVNIYNKLIKAMLTWIIPFAFVGVYPAAYFLGHGVSRSFAMLTPVMGVVFLTAGLVFWNGGVKRYRGAGS